MLTLSGYIMVLTNGWIASLCPLQVQPAMVAVLWLASLNLAASTAEDYTGAMASLRGGTAARLGSHSAAAPKAPCDPTCRGECFEGHCLYDGSDLNDEQDLGLARWRAQQLRREPSKRRWHSVNREHDESVYDWSERAAVVQENAAVPAIPSNPGILTAKGYPTRSLEQQVSPVVSAEQQGSHIEKDPVVHTVRIMTGMTLLIVLIMLFLVEAMLWCAGYGPICSYARPLLRSAGLKPYLLELSDLQVSGLSFGSWSESRHLVGEEVFLCAVVRTRRIARTRPMELSKPGCPLQFGEALTIPLRRHSGPAGLTIGVYRKGELSERRIAHVDLLFSDLFNLLRHGSMQHRFNLRLDMSQPNQVGGSGATPQQQPVIEMRINDVSESMWSEAPRRSTKGRAMLL